jgi:hypothetical protein
MQNLIRKAVLPVLLATACAGANAGVLTYQGVTFTTTFAGNVLTLEIDAAHPSGDWLEARTMGALGIKEIGTFSSVQLLQAPGAASGWMFSTDELNGNGCANGGQPDKNVCYQGTRVNLTDDMVFKFAFTGGMQDFTSPHLKVNFFDSDGKKAGTLLSMNVPPGDTPPTTPVSEPSTAGMLMGGLALAGLVARRRRQG